MKTPDGQTTDFAYVTSVKLESSFIGEDLSNGQKKVTIMALPGENGKPSVGITFRGGCETNAECLITESCQGGICLGCECGTCQTEATPSHCTTCAVDAGATCTGGICEDTGDPDTYCQPIGTLAIQLNQPAADSAIFRGQTLTLDATATCSGGSCGSVEMRAKQETSPGAGQQDIPPAGTPFTTPTSAQSCGLMLSGATCQKTWTITATGTGGENKRLYADAESAAPYSLTATSEPTSKLVTIIRPDITSVNPALGDAAGGTVITITGSNFLNGATVKIDGNDANSIVVVDSNTITAKTPAGTAGAKDVTVTNPDTGTYTKSGAFTYYVPPEVISATPEHDYVEGDTPITITGKNFKTGATVKIGGSAATGVVVVDSGTITAKTPSGSAGDAPVTVTNPDTGTHTKSGIFTYHHTRAFVTSTAFSNGAFSLGGLFGAVAAADSKCQQLADNANLGGNWVAWLSSGTSSSSMDVINAIERIPDRIYARMDAAIIANSKAELTGGSIQNPISLDENKNTVNAGVWTGTKKADGTPAYKEGVCFHGLSGPSWTSVSPSYDGWTGKSSATDGKWTTDVLAKCNTAGKRIYCFQTGFN